MAQEKKALDIAFLASPVVSFAAPFITKDVAIIWWLNAAVMGASYAYAFSAPESVDEENGDEVNDVGSGTSSAGRVLIKAFKALDYGSGKERGTRK